MPKKPRSAGPTGPASAPVTRTPARPRPSLLERIRAERDAGFHSPERLALMTTAEGRDAYASVQLDLPLDERLRLFERVVEEALNQYRYEALLYSQHAHEAPAAQAALHRTLLAPLIPAWTQIRAQIVRAIAAASDPEVGAALHDATRALTGAAAAAGNGDAREAGQASFDARLHLDRAAHRLRSLDRTQEAAELLELATRVERDWPGPGALQNVTTPSFHEGVAAGEQSRDLQAVARWFAPVLGQACVAAGMDATVIREVGNTFSRAGGGAPHLVRVWPEQRARIQVLADQAARPLPPRVGQHARVGKSAGPRVTLHPAQLSWKALHHLLSDEVHGKPGLESVLPSSPGALRKAAERGRSPWAPLHKDRTRATARRVLESLRES